MDRKDDAVTLVPYGRDFDFDNRRCLVLGGETKSRLAKMWEVVGQYSSPLIVLSAGFARRYLQKHSMAQMMREHLLFSYPLYAGNVIVHNQEGGNVWGSDAETRAAIAIIKNRKLPRRVIVISSWYHLPRLWLLWKLSLRGEGWNWKVTFVSCNAHGKWHMILWEAVSILGTLLGLKTAPWKCRRD